MTIHETNGLLKEYSRLSGTLHESTEATPISSGLFGSSGGKSVLRIQFEGSTNRSEYIACARKVTWFQRLFRYTSCEVAINGERKTIWLNTNSLKKRLSGSPQQIELLKKISRRLGMDTEKRANENVIHKIQKATKLPRNEIENILQYAENNKQEEPTIVRRNESHCKRTLFLGPGSNYILLTIRKNGDPVLGEGSWKRVKIAIDLFTGKEYAVATCDISNDKEATTDEEIASEIAKHEIFKDCPQIVKMHTFCVTYKKDQEKKQVYLILDKCEGDLYGELFKKRKSFSSRKKLSFAHDIAKGIAAIHEKKHLHRDLKEQNIFLYNDNGTVRPVIGDLGFCCSTIDDEKKRLELSGTAFYQSPEKASIHFQKAKTEEKIKQKPDKAKELTAIMNQKILEATTYAEDTWAFGIVLFSLFSNGQFFKNCVLNGREFQDRTDQASIYLYLLQSITQNQVNMAIMDAIDDPAICSLMQRLLSVDPKKRPDMRAVAKQLEQMAVS